MHNHYFYFWSFNYILLYLMQISDFQFLQK